MREVSWDYHKDDLRLNSEGKLVEDKSNIGGLKYSF